NYPCSPERITHASPLHRVQETRCRTRPARLRRGRGRVSMHHRSISSGVFAGLGVLLWVTSARADYPRFPFAANGGDDTISMYTVDAATGQLTQNGYALTGHNPRAVTVDGSGTFAYVANGSSNNVSAFRIDPLTGQLTSIGGPFATGAG